MEINPEKDIPIDVNALDIESLNQPELEQRYIDRLSELRGIKMEADENVKTIRSELIRQANESPEECCNKPKPNANDIEAYYRTHTDYKEAKEEYIEAFDQYESFKDTKDLIHFTRAQSIENLITLYGQSYFAGPSNPRDLKKIQRERAEERTKRIAKKGMKRKKK